MDKLRKIEDESLQVKIHNCNVNRNYSWLQKKKLQRGFPNKIYTE